MATLQSPALYEIRVEGILGNRWTAWFEGLQIISDASQTVIRGWLPDQSALHGVLVKVGDLGLSLISVRRLDPGGAEEATPAMRHQPDTGIISAARETRAVRSEQPQIRTEDSDR
jgi:hypothetical protein